MNARNVAIPDFLTRPDVPLWRERAEADPPPPVTHQLDALLDVVRKVVVEGHEAWHTTILGPRGGGKTSALNYLERRLKEDEKLTIVRLRAHELFDAHDGGNGTTLNAFGMLAWSIVRGMDDQATSLQESAARLLLGGIEAGQAAIAFAPGPGKYAETYAKSLADFGAHGEFVNGLREYLGKARRALVLLVDDVDWEPRHTLRLLRAVSYLRDVDGVAVIAAGDKDWIRCAVERFLREEVRLPGARLEDTRMVERTLLGSELELLSWSASRQIAFFVRPGLADGAALDARCVWSWLAAERSHSEFVRKLIAADASVGWTGKQSKATRTAYFKSYEDYVPWDDFVAFDRFVGGFVEGKDYDFYTVLLKQLLPGTARQLVQTTNDLVRAVQNWRNPVHNLERLLDPKVVGDRRSRLITYLGIERWRTTPLGNLLGQEAWLVRRLLAAEDAVVQEDGMVVDTQGEGLEPSARAARWLEQLNEGANDLYKEEARLLLRALGDAYRRHKERAEPYGNAAAPPKRGKRRS